MRKYHQKKIRVITNENINLGSNVGAGSFKRVFKFLNNLSLNVPTYNNVNIEPIDKCNLRYINYYGTENSGITEGVSTWQGACYYKNNQVLLCGTTQPGPVTGLGLIYIGNIQCNSTTQTYYTFIVPGSEYTSCYGPRYNFQTDVITLVGSYTYPNNSNNYGFLFRGKIEQLTDETKYITHMNMPLPDQTSEYTQTFVHSTDGNFAVGSSGNLSTQTLNAWIYNIDKKTYTPYTFNNSVFTTLYGIIYNLDGTYTIVGGWSDGTNNPTTAFIADMIYNPESGNLSFINNTSISYDDHIITHFEGISSTNNPNFYTIAGDSVGKTNSNIGISSIIMRDTVNGIFKVVKTTKIDYSCSYGQKGIQSSNSVIGNNIIGYYVTSGGNSSFQCSIDWNKV